MTPLFKLLFLQVSIVQRPSGECVCSDPAFSGATCGEGDCGPGKEQHFDKTKEVYVCKQCAASAHKPDTAEASGSACLASGPAVDVASDSFLLAARSQEPHTTTTTPWLHSQPISPSAATR